MKKIVLTTVSVLALGVNTSFAAEDSATGTAHATLLQPTTIEEVVQMQFGNMLKGNHAVKVDTADNRTGEAAYLIGSTGDKTPKSGKFKIEGTPNQAITISSPADFEVSNGNNAMTVDNVQLKLNGGGDQTGGTDFSGAIKDDGTAELMVGGTLNVTESSPEGDYTGTYDIKVSY